MATPSLRRARRVVSITLPTTGAIKEDYDDVTEVTTNIVIENTDLISLEGWFPNLVLVSGNVQIRNNGELTTMTTSFQKLEIISEYLDIFGNDALVELGSAFPFPGGGGLVTGYVSIYNNPVLLSLGSALKGLVTITGYCSVYGNAELATLDTAFDDLVTVTGYLSIYGNPELASLGAAFSSLVTVTGYTSFANNPSLLCALDVGSQVVIQTGACQLSAAPTGPTAAPSWSSPSTAPSSSAPTTRVVASITLPTTGAIGMMHDYDDVVEVTTNIVIENTDLTSLAGWFPNLVLVTGNVQITNNAALTTMTTSPRSPPRSSSRTPT